MPRIFFAALIKHLHRSISREIPSTTWRHLGRRDFLAGKKTRDHALSRLQFVLINKGNDGATSGAEVSSA
jgi:hypothetical protein